MVSASARVLGGILWTELPASAPTWRGIPCKWGNTQLWLRNNLRPALHPDAWMPFSVLALFPDRDLPGPTPAFFLLGTDFFKHHSRLRITLRYGDIEYEAGPRGPMPRAFSDCGEISA